MGVVYCMAKFYGKIGFVETAETTPGIWEPIVTERNYSGNLERNSRRRDTPNNINDDLSISNSISIVADPYVMNHFHSMEYVEFSGIKWKISDVEVQYPRLILTIGGEYNGKQA
jgi:hypothetical protein